MNGGVKWANNSWDWLVDRPKLTSFLYFSSCFQQFPFIQSLTQLTAPLATVRKVKSANLEKFVSEKGQENEEQTQGLRCCHLMLQIPQLQRAGSL